MKRAEHLIAQARAATAAKAGIRLKARIPEPLWKRVQRCAAAASTPTEEWVNLVCRAWQTGKYDGVPISEKHLLATRANSRPQWVRIPASMETSLLKTALLEAVTVHEPAIRHYTPQPGTEHWLPGRDYKIAKDVS